MIFELQLRSILDTKKDLKKSVRNIQEFWNEWEMVYLASLFLSFHITQQNLFYVYMVQHGLLNDNLTKSITQLAEWNSNCNIFQKHVSTTFFNMFQQHVSTTCFNNMFCSFKWYPIWYNITWFDLIWSNLIRFDPIWSNLIQFDPIWSNSIKFDPIYSNLN